MSKFLYFLVCSAFFIHILSDDHWIIPHIPPFYNLKEPQNSFGFLILLICKQIVFSLFIHLQREKEKVMENKRQVQHLVTKSKSIVRLKPRNPEEKSSSPIIVRALCDFKQDQVSSFTHVYITRGFICRKLSSCL